MEGQITGGKEWAKKNWEEKKKCLLNKNAVTEKKKCYILPKGKADFPQCSPLSLSHIPSPPAQSLSFPAPSPVPLQAPAEAPTSPACHCHPVSPPSLASTIHPSFLHPRPPPSGGGRWITPVLPPPLPTTAAGQASAEPKPTWGWQRNCPPIPSGGGVLVAGALLPRGLLLWWQRTLRSRRGSPQQHSVRCQQHR